MTVIIDEVSSVSEASVESSASAVHWGAIVGGALGAVGITMVLITLAPGLGLATVSPWAIGSSPPATFGIVAGDLVDHHAMAFVGARGLHCGTPSREVGRSSDRRDPLS